MTDGVHEPHAGAFLEMSDDVAGVEVSAHAPRTPSTLAARKPCLAELAEYLPQLGPVLWLQHLQVGKQQAFAQHSESLLPGHPALGVLASCSRLRAHYVITAHGPREWLCVCNGIGTIEARLFLLPDTNVLAWDEFVAALRIVPTAADCHELPTHNTFLGRALSRCGQRWQARLLEFRSQQVAGQSKLNALPPLRISLLGMDIASNIVRDEYAEWIPTIHLG